MQSPFGNKPKPPQRAIGVPVSGEEAAILDQFAEYLYDQNEIERPDIADLMLYAARRLLSDHKNAVEFMERKQRVEQLRRRTTPAHYLLAANQELDSMNSELDGHVQGDDYSYIGRP